MRIRWVRLALSDLRDIDDYISQDSPKAASAILKRLWESVLVLADHPHIGRPGRVSGTRELFVSGTPFIIPYRVVEGEVQILRIPHSSRKWPDEIG